MDNQNSSNRRNFLVKSAVASTGLIFGGALLSTSCNSSDKKSERIATTSTNKSDKEMKTHNRPTRKLGNLEVSAQGLGCMGMTYHRSFIPNKKDMIALLRKAPYLGMNFYDTAEAYGPLTNEVLVGEAVQPFRKEIILATKFGFKDGVPKAGLDSRPERIRQVVETSLKNLRTDYIDLLYQHRVDPNVPMEDVAGTVKDLIQEGKVLHFGMSEASVESIKKAHAVQPVTAVQSEYSLMTREREKDVIQLCEELGIGFVAYSPISRGLITGYINERTKYNPDNDNRQDLPRYQADNIITNWKLIDTLKAFGDQRGLTVAQVAIAWLMAQKPFIVPIPGTTKLAHLQENLWASNYQFDNQELTELTTELNKIEIVGDRYTGLMKSQTGK
ncbi:aldo/keto reductase [Urechidicola croceus]|nr:aldo/keto reductase [Urechidicola croceus]